MDNLNVHRAKKVKEKMIELEIEPVFNIIY